MQSATTRMQTLINDLLNYSQMNTRAVNLQKVNLNKVIHEVLIDLDNTIQENKAVVHLAEMPSLSVDEAQLRQVFQNLISNAIKFKKPDVDPEIIIESKQITGKESGITMQEEDFSKLYYDITIADNGIGFEQKYAEQIFQIFQRLHGRSDYPGTGIGLAIVQKAVENHHGYIYSESEPERGAKFHVMLPVST
jgi:light-regulated signal transduction histidine kinase (bacteriophytochrome)